MPAKKKESKASVTITRSFARKLNMSAHGGKQYETADISCSATMVSFTPETTAIQLDAFCRREVERTIEALDEQTLEVLKEDAPKIAKKKKTVDLGVKVEQEELEGMQEYINDLTLSKSASDLKTAVMKIKKDSAKFNEDQKKYLSLYYQKRKAALS